MSVVIVVVVVVVVIVGEDQVGKPFMMMALIMQLGIACVVVVGHGEIYYLYLWLCYIESNGCVEASFRASPLVIMAYRL